MKKLLLVALTWMVLAGADRAYHVPTVLDESEIITTALRQVRKTAYRLVGRALGAFIGKGMGEERVAMILGKPTHMIDILRTGQVMCVYSSLGIRVIFGDETNAAGSIYYQVDEVRFVSLFD